MSRIDGMVYVINSDIPGWEPEVYATRKDAMGSFAQHARVWAKFSPFHVRVEVYMADEWRSSGNDFPAHWEDSTAEDAPFDVSTATLAIARACMACESAREACTDAILALQKANDSLRDIRQKETEK